jgi:hypothetical protein
MGGKVGAEGGRGGGEVRCFAKHFRHERQKRRLDNLTTNTTHTLREVTSHCNGLCFLEMSWRAIRCI